jgi:hypothetical protein
LIRNFAPKVLSLQFVALTFIVYKGKHQSRTRRLNKRDQLATGASCRAVHTHDLVLENHFKLVLAERLADMSISLSLDFGGLLKHFWWDELKTDVMVGHSGWCRRIAYQPLGFG